MQVPSLVVSGALVLLLAACGDDVPASAAADAENLAADADAQVAIDTSGPVFLPIGGTATTNTVTIDGIWTESQHVRIEVAVNRFSDLFGIAGHLHYDPKVLQLTALQANAVPLGDKKDTSDYKPRAVAKEAPVGRILLGGARLSNVPSPFDTPTGVKVTHETWLVLEFSVLQKVATTIAFDPNTLVVRNGAYTEVPTDWGQLQISWAKIGGAP